MMGNANPTSMPPRKPQQSY